MSISVRQKTSYRITAILAAAFLLRAFIPVGYMPGNLLAGDFVELCPVGISFGSAAHHAGHDAGMAETDANQTCPLGLGLKFLGAPAINLDIPAVAPPPFAVARLIGADDLVTPLTPLQPRAPPKRIPA